MTKSCSSLLFLVFLTLFKGVEGIDGGYSDWSEWSKCSKPCGGGMQQMSRTCTNPKPEGNGTTCEEQGLGPAMWSKDCNIDSCIPLVVYYIFVTLIVLGMVACLLVPLWYCPCFNKKNPRQTAATSLVSRESTEGRHLPSYSEAGLQQLHSGPPQQSGSNSAMLQIVNRQSTSHSPAHRAVGLPITRERSVPTANPPELLTVALPPLHYGEEPPPPYSAEETSPPHSREEPPPAYSTEETSPPYSREELPSPYSREEPLSPYAMTTLV